MSIYQHHHSSQTVNFKKILVKTTGSLVNRQLEQTHVFAWSPFQNDVSQDHTKLITLPDSSTLKPLV